MIVAVASGKGGTGKTFISAHLARIISSGSSGSSSTLLLDCDVEEPNSHLFIPGRHTRTEVVDIQVPEVDSSLCDGCGECVRVCEFNAIAIVAKAPMIFDELCHACGACQLFCPKKALHSKEHRIGEIDIGEWEGITLVQGKLDVGVALAVPLIRAVKRRISAESDRVSIIDCPPGTSCPMVWSVSGCDAVILVAEPTPFGLNDLRLAVETLREVDLPFGVVINKDGIGDDRVLDYCAVQKIPVLGRIPHDRRVAIAYAEGQLVSDVLPEYRLVFRNLWQATMDLVAIGGSYGGR
ncbi:MAG: (4Fe-4S)-binding protein [Spirochaetae bacterium HGW-Spirochaetae-8]|jgi:MinD superfamily P-loop ATPase|nr:MAG: (4Fe-4S)-binding protein [Spirochaetae bacterium HGW-Spirochaetae-8]